MAAARRRGVRGGRSCSPNEGLHPLSCRLRAQLEAGCTHGCPRGSPRIAQG